MSIAIAIQVLALVAVASASLSSYSYQYKRGNTNFVYGSEVSVVTPQSRFSEHYSYPYTYFTYYAHHKEYIYTYETCSSPPSSIEVCLSSIFSSIESGLSSIESELKLHEVTIKYDMHHEHTLLSSEVSFVYEVDAIAKSVKEIVNENYYALYEQVEALLIEKQDIYAAYMALEKELLDIEAQVKEVENDGYEIVEEYESIRYAKWSVYSAISAILYEKIAVQEEVVEVEYVVAYLNEEVEKIYGKIEQLNKRQNWLVSWQEKLYEDLSGFEVQVRRFKGVEAGLYAREKDLYIEQARLLAEAEAVQIALEKLRAEYEYVEREVIYIEGYEYLVEEIDEYIKAEASVFISAYEEFTCEDSLLYYEACASSSPSSSSSSAAAAPAAAPAPAPKKPAASAPAKKGAAVA